MGIVACFQKVRRGGGPRGMMSLGNITRQALEELHPQYK